MCNAVSNITNRVSNFSNWDFTNTDNKYGIVFNLLKPIL